MGIEKLKSSLLSEAKEDAKRIVEAAQAHVQNMLNEERTKGAALAKQIENEIENVLTEQHNERMAWARLESKRMLSEAREDAIKNALDAVFTELHNARKSPEYKRFIKNAVANAVAELGNSVVIHIAKGDKTNLPPVKNAKIVEDLNGMGGVRVENANGKVIVDFTLETFFESRRDDVRKQLYDRLFGGKSS